MRKPRAARQISSTKYRPYRDIYVTRMNGELVRIVHSMHHMEADRLGVEYVHNWRLDYLDGKLQEGALICCDDGWLVRFLRIQHTSMAPIMHLETGIHRMPIMAIRTRPGFRTENTESTKLNAYVLTSCPTRTNYYERKRGSGSVHTDLNQVKIRLIAKRYLENGFDFDEAWTHVTKEVRSKFTRTAVEHSHVWRLAVQAEARKYYDKSGVTVERIFKMLMERAEAAGTLNSEALEIAHELLRYHPDLAPNDIQVSAPQRALPVSAWLGDANYLEATTVPATPLPAPPPSEPVTLPLPETVTVEPVEEEPVNA